MKILSIDLETLGHVDIKSAGGYKYAESCEILLFGYAYDDNPVRVIDLTNGEEIPRSVLLDLAEPDVLKTAYNAQFERTVLTHYLRKQDIFEPDEWLDPRQWLCTMVLGLTLGLPGNLAGLGEALGLSEDEKKMAIGKKLIREFCIQGRGHKTPAEDPENWKLFVEYNRRDVETERILRKRLWNYRPSPEEHELWALDQRINDAGVTIDRQMAEAAIRIDAEIREDIMAKAKAITGLENPASGPQLKKWIQQSEGLAEPPASLTKATVPELIKTAKQERTKEALRLRLQLGKTSTKKYQAMLDALGSDGKVHGLFQFYGAARTGRWAGRLVQTQNLPRCYLDDLDDAREVLKGGDREIFEALYEDVPDTLSQLIRTAFTASPGCRLIDCDFSSIEARVIAWLADEAWRQKVFENNGDIYCASASQMFRCPVEKHGQNAELRQKGKIAELALGYGGGVGALKAFGADQMGLSETDMQDIVAKWRESSPRICQLWQGVEVAARRAIRNPCTAFPCKHNVLFAAAGEKLMVQLPSGRKLVYQQPEIFEEGAAITYMGTNQTTRKWERIETWGGKLVENIVQAIARDCLAEALMNLDRAGYRIIMHIHDEVVLDVPEGEGSLAEVERIMSEPIAWAPGLILNAEGWEDRYFKKD
jgi:DNA polymerase